MNILVEASERKRPSKQTLGGYKEIFNPSSTNNGHVPRNVRLTLLVTDFVEPWVNVETVNDKKVVDRDRIPGIGRNSTSCETRNRVEVPGGTTELKVKWTVWGSAEVDETNVLLVEVRRSEERSESKSVILPSYITNTLPLVASLITEIEGRWFGVRC